jgi:hypothetical protein
LAIAGWIAIKIYSFAGLFSALRPDEGDDDPLYQAALAVERDMRLAGEMAEWEAATIGDGLTVAPSRKRRR